MVVGGSVVVVVVELVVSPGSVELVVCSTVVLVVDDSSGGIRDSSIATSLRSTKNEFTSRRTVSVASVSSVYTVSTERLARSRWASVASTSSIGSVERLAMNVSGAGSPIASSIGTVPPVSRPAERITATSMIVMNRMPVLISAERLTLTIRSPRSGGRPRRSRRRCGDGQHPVRSALRRQCPRSRRAHQRPSSAPTRARRKDRPG